MNKLFEKPSMEVNIKHFFKAGLNPNVNQISLNNELKVLTFKLLFGHNDFQLNLFQFYCEFQKSLCRKNFNKLLKNIALLNELPLCSLMIA